MHVGEHLGDGAALENVHALLCQSIQPNLFDSHPPFQIDGNFGATAGIAEMLLQSHDGCITLLPAMPEKWLDGQIRGLRARGGVTVDMCWRNRQLEHALLVSDSDQLVCVRYYGRVVTVELQAGMPITVDQALVR